MEVPQPFTAKLRSAVRSAAYWPRTWRLVWQAAPGWTVGWAMTLLIQGLLPVASVALTKPAIDSVVAALRPDRTSEEIQQAFLLIGLLAGAFILIEVVQALAEFLRAGQAELVHDHVTDLVQRQSSAVDLSFFHQSDYHDQLARARQEAGARPTAWLEGLGSLIQNGLTLLAMGALLLPYGPWLPVVLVLSTLPALWVTLHFDRRYHRWWQRTTVERRRAGYYDGLLTNGLAAAEVRLFDLSEHFRSAYQVVRGRLRGERLAHQRRHGWARLGASAIGLAVTGGAVAWLVGRAAVGAVTLGDIGLFYQAFQRGQGLLRALLGNLGQLYGTTLYLGNLFSFLDLEAKIIDPADPAPAPARLTGGIVVRNVSFRYPGSERPALQGLNLELPAGKIVAIVGPNGAGKTTLVKLLCRFYDVDHGRIEFDGTDLRAFRVADLRRAITVLFQFPLTYQATAAENIALGDLPARPDRAAIETAARGAGIDDLIASLPDGYQTLLSTAYERGTDLSGGEWQRLAMARAYLRQAPVMLLDEPTSLMDSWAEAAWFERLRALARDRVALVITHRFTIAMRADIIYVLEDGQVAEAGSHAELVARDGLYARSWIAQMRSSDERVPDLNHAATLTPPLTSILVGGELRPPGFDPKRPRS